MHGKTHPHSRLSLALLLLVARSPPSISLSRKQKGGKPTRQYAQWYGADYTAVEAEDTDPADTAELIEAWDGCTYVEALGEHPNVPGIGEVTQVWRDLFTAFDSPVLGPVHVVAKESGFECCTRRGKCAFRCRPGCCGALMCSVKWTEGEGKRCETR